jgi:hypothetical protein
MNHTIPGVADAQEHAFPEGTKVDATNDICSGVMSIVNIGTYGEVVAPDGVLLGDGKVSVKFEKSCDEGEISKLCVLLADIGKVGRMPDLDLDSISLKLSGVLRHNGERRGLHFSRDGFASVKEVIDIMRHPLSLADVRQVVDNNFNHGMPRFQLREAESETEGPSIRATRHACRCAVCNVHAVDIHVDLPQVMPMKSPCTIASEAIYKLKHSGRFVWDRHRFTVGPPLAPPPTPPHHPRLISMISIDIH